MELQHARTIVMTLAQGVDPTSGEVFAPDSPYNQPSVIRALFKILETARPSRPPRLSIEERRQKNLEVGRPRNTGLPWTDEDRARVATGFREGRSIEDLASGLERSRSAIVAEVLRQDLVAPDLR